MLDGCFLYPLFFISSHIHLVTSPLEVLAKWRPFKENLKVYWTNLLSITFLQTIRLLFGNVSMCAELNSSPSLFAFSALLCSSFNVKKKKNSTFSSGTFRSSLGMLLSGFITTKRTPNSSGILRQTQNAWHAW